MKEIIYSKKANRFLDSQSVRVAERIISKVKWLSVQTNILRFAKALTNMSPATHRLRIGHFRITISLDMKNDRMMVYDIDTRGRIYKK